MDSMSECSRCLLTDQVPGVVIDKDSGLCNVCRDWDNKWGDWQNRKKENLLKLERILDSACRKKRPYDVLVPISGGKDSLYVLYLCRKRFGLRCLAMTADNCFLSEDSRENIKNACERLRVDHVWYTPNKPFLYDIYSYSFKKTGFFCHFCMRSGGVGMWATQVAFNIPLMIKGTSKRTEEHVSPEYFTDSRDFMENILEDSPFTEEPAAMAMLSPPGMFKSPLSIQIADYIDWNYDEIYSTIREELGFKERLPGVEHDGCIVNQVVDYIRYRKFPALVPEMLKLSKLVTCGQMAREEAKKLVAQKALEVGEPENLDWFLNEMHVSRAEFESLLANPLQHMKYFKQRSRIKRRLGALKKRYF